MKQIVVIGAGGHARVVADVIRLTGEYRLRGFIEGIDTDRHDEEFEGSRILGGHDMLPDLIKVGVTHAAIAIGDNSTRARLATLAVEMGFSLPVLAHRSAIIAAGVVFDSGCLVCAGAILNPGVKLGHNVIINTGASVDHDCIVEDNVHIAPGARLAGGVQVRAGALIGVGASVIPNVSIGAHAVVGAGAAVVRDVSDGTTVGGVPARVLK